MITVKDFTDRFEYKQETGELIYKKGSFYKGKVAGYYNPDGPVIIHVLGKNYAVHRVVWHMHHGEAPQWPIVHLNGNKHDNRIENLKQTPHKEHK